MHQAMTLPLIAILRGITVDQVDEHLPLLIDAGFQSIEIPLNSPEWEKSLGRAVKNYGDLVTIGAGTVTDVASVLRLSELGCQLVITPNTQPDVIRTALLLNMAVMPGCVTATEAFTAIDAGAPQIKIFPASLLGAGYIRALKAVLPTDVAIWAVGGITPGNLADYLRAGCAGAGLGGDLYQAGQTPEQTQSRAQAFTSAWQTFASSLSTQQKEFV